jgi:plasmid stability protein
MPANLLIRNVPEELVERLRQRAAAHHRSLQGELRAILEQAVPPKRMTPEEVLAEVTRRGLKTPDESAAIIRATRDGYRR